MDATRGWPADWRCRAGRWARDRAPDGADPGGRHGTGPDGGVRHAAGVFAAAVDDGLLDLPMPGRGRTLARLAALAGLGEVDPVLARLGEGHADALAILAELAGGSPDAGGAGPEPADGTPRPLWGVWAAMPDSVRAERTADGWRLAGDRPWCSGAGTCTHALVVAAAGDGRRLFAVRVRPPWAVPVPGTWPAVGMAGSDSRTVRFADAPAVPVGGPGWYVDRPGFWHGAIGVAACWYGGAVGVARPLLDAARHRDPGPHVLAHLGAVDAALTSAGQVLREAARFVDDHPRRDAHLVAARVRATVEATATEVLDRVGRALGARPLGQDAAHARRVADLTVYLRQSHAERDLATLGELVAAGGEPGW
jgi:hypothetical protein